MWRALSRNRKTALAVYVAIVLLGGAVAVSQSGEIAQRLYPDSTPERAAPTNNTLPTNANESTGLTTETRTDTTTVASPPAAPGPQRFPLPPSQPAPRSPCENAYRSQTSGAASSAELARLWALAGGRDLVWTRDCGHLHAWNDHLREPAFTNYRYEAGILAALRAAELDDWGYAQRFFDTAFEAPVDRRLHSEIAAYAYLSTFQTRDARAADANQSVPVHVAAAIFQLRADVVAGLATGNATFFAHGIDAVQGVIDASSNKAHEFLLRVERAAATRKIPTLWDVDSRADAAWALENPIGPHLAPYWDLVYVDHSREPDFGPLLENEYRRVFGTGASYAQAASATRWDKEPIPYCLDAAFPAEHAVKVRPALSQWEHTLSQRFTFVSQSTCSDLTALRLTLGAARGNFSSAFDARTDGKITGCRVEINPDAPADDWEWLILHEVGHCLGLPHSPFEGDIMSYRRADVATITARDAETLRILWDGPVLSLAMGRGWVTPASRNITGSEVASVNWTIRGSVLDAGGASISTLYLDFDGDLKTDATLAPGQSLVRTFTSYGTVGVALDHEGTFRGASTQSYEILIRR